MGKEKRQKEEKPGKRKKKLKVRENPDHIL